MEDIMGRIFSDCNFGVDIRAAENALEKEKEKIPVLEEKLAQELSYNEYRRNQIARLESKLQSLRDSHSEGAGGPKQPGEGLNP